PASYIGLVASRTRGDVIRDTLIRRGLSTDRIERLVYPAGLDMGHVSDEEIALSIFAQILMNRQKRVADLARQADEPIEKVAEAIDPICDMVVAITPS